MDWVTFGMKLTVMDYLGGIWVVIRTDYRVAASRKAHREGIAAFWQLGKGRKTGWHHHSFWVSQNH